MADTRIDEIVDKVKAAYAILAPQGKTDAYDGMESARVTAEMLTDSESTHYSDSLFVQKVYELANAL